MEMGTMVVVEEHPLREWDCQVGHEKAWVGDYLVDQGVCGELGLGKEDVDILVK